MRFTSWLLNRKPKRQRDLRLPEFLPILQEMAREWESITNDDFARVERSFRTVEEGETKLGVLHSSEARRTFALAHVMSGRCKEARLYAENRAQDDTEAKYYSEQAARFDTIADCLRQLFWAQTKDDIGGKCWTAGAIGVRDGWMIIATSPPRMPDLAKLFGAHEPE